MIATDPTQTFSNGQAISETAVFLKEGDSYMGVVLNAHKRPQIFTRELVFNLLTLAIEKHAMAILMACGTLPENHTFLDLLDGLKWVLPVSESNHATLLTLHREESMCSIDAPVTSRIPTAEQMIDYVELGKRMQTAAREMVSGAANPSFALE